MLCVDSGVIVSQLLEAREDSPFFSPRRYSSVRSGAVSAIERESRERMLTSSFKHRQNANHSSVDKPAEHVAGGAGSYPNSVPSSPQGELLLAEGVC